MISLAYEPRPAAQPRAADAVVRLAREADRRPHARQPGPRPRPRDRRRALLRHRPGRLRVHRRVHHPQPLPQALRRRRALRRVHPALRPGDQAGITPNEANDFAAASVNLLCAILLVITIVGELALWAMILLGDRLCPDLVLTLKLTAIMLPYVLLICGTAFLSGILQVHHRFGATAAAPIILNVVPHHRDGDRRAVAAPAGDDAARPGGRDPDDARLLAGGLRARRRRRCRSRCCCRACARSASASSPVLALLDAAGPADAQADGAGGARGRRAADFRAARQGHRDGLMQRLDTAGTSSPTSTSSATRSASRWRSGAPRRLDMAQFLYQFPLGVFAIALATAIFPDLSAEALEKDRDRFRNRSSARASRRRCWRACPRASA